jgi:hypothetical protein
MRITRPRHARRGPQKLCDSLSDTSDVMAACTSCLQLHPLQRPGSRVHRAYVPDTTYTGGYTDESMRHRRESKAASTTVNVYVAVSYGVICSSQVSSRRPSFACIAHWTDASASGEISTGPLSPLAVALSPPAPPPAPQARAACLVLPPAPTPASQAPTCPRRHRPLHAALVASHL